MSTEARRVPAQKPAIAVIMNGRIASDFRPVENSAKAIAIRSLAMKSKREIQSYLAATYQFARQNKLAFNMTAIDQSAPGGQGIGFDTDYMRALYALGNDSARSGRFWVQTPPVP
jgi:hypothetical protein